MNDTIELNESQLPFLASTSSSSNLTGTQQSTANNSNTNNTTTANNTSQVADVTAFITYLKQFVPALLDANLASLTDFEKCMNEKATLETIKKFLGETQVRTLIIQKFINYSRVSCILPLLNCSEIAVTN